MLPFFLWYLLVTFLGWLTFPLAWRLFPALKDRGYGMSRALGMLVWGFIFWLLVSLGVVQNNGGGLLLALFLVAAASGYGLLRKEKRQALWEWIRSNGRVVITVELLFLLAFAFLAVVRAANPEIIGTEKPMELAFINAIIHSPTFPPHDPWLSGYAISYYYFGYVMTAMLAKATGTLAGVAFNLMLALIFALSAVGAYGVLYNLLSLLRKPGRDGAERKPSTGLPLFGPLFLLLVSNFEGFLDVLHQRGLFWKFGANGTATSAFWTWLDLQDLRDAPIHLGWVPERYYWWWRASRVITEYNLAHAWNEIIDEFPFFSYLLGDLHPHVLAMPFLLLTVGVALNLFLGGWKGETNLGLARLRIRPEGVLFGAVLLGGLAFLNTWDILPGFALLAGAYLLGQVRRDGWSWRRLEDLVVFGLPVGLLGILLYLPFYASFSSQAGGIIPNLEFPTRGAQLWVMFGPLFLPIFAFFLYLWWSEKRPASWLKGFGLAGGLALFLWVFAWGLALLAKWRMPDFVQTYLASLGGLGGTAYFIETTLKRLSFLGGLLTMLALLGTALAFLARREEEKEGEQDGDDSGPLTIQPSTFVLLLVVVGGLLILAPDFVYLRDQFGNRMNTIFKFYYQAWMVLSIAAAFGVTVMLQNLRGAWGWVYRLGLVLVLFMALVYPVLGLQTKTDSFKVKTWTLDGGAYLRGIYPADMAAADWLRSAPYGVMVEATKSDASYHAELCFVSSYSGLPTVLGWPMHEGQWRGSYTPQGTRQDDIRTLYESSRWDETQAVLSRYDIRYVYVGTQERTTYHLFETKFQQYLTVVYQADGVTIYEVPSQADVLK